MNPQQPQSPQQIIGYQPDGTPVYAPTQPPQQSPLPVPPAPIAPPTSAPVPPQNSHVTAAPQSLEGQSFDPQIRSQYANEPGVTHATRPIEPEDRGISEELQKRHEESKKKYPFLNLSEGEVVIMNLHRHPIGLLMPLAAGGIIILALMAVLIMYPTNAETLGLPGFGLAAFIMGLLMALVGIGTYIAVWIYLQNQFFMTNESVIQEIQHSLFSRHEQTVSLGSIEDASFKKNGILQTLLDYGTIRLSTEGEETTYRFHFVSRPRDQVAILNNGVEAFKNGRPVELDPKQLRKTS